MLKQAAAAALAALIALSTVPSQERSCLHGPSETTAQAARLVRLLAATAADASEPT